MAERECLLRRGQRLEAGAGAGSVLFGDASREVVRGNHQSGVQVEPVSVGPVKADTGVEMQLLAAKSPALLDEPLEQAPAMAAAPGLGQCREVVDVEVVTPGKVLTDPEPRHSGGAWLALVEGANEPVALRPLHLIDAADERAFIGKVSSQRPHGVEGRAGIGRENLANHGRILEGVPDEEVLRAPPP